MRVRIALIVSIFSILVTGVIPSISYAEIPGGGCSYLTEETLETKKECEEFYYENHGAKGQVQDLAGKVGEEGSEIFLVVLVACFSIIAVATVLPKAIIFIRRFI